MNQQDRGEPQPAARIYELLIDDDDTLAEQLPDAVAAAVPANALKLILASALQKAGDLTVDAKTVLAWLLAGVGAPAVITGLLVPIRESGSMLPQILLSGFVRRKPERRWFWVVGAGGQAAAVAAMALLAATATGAVAGWGVLAALAVFALFRSLSSLAAKDVLGRTIPRGARGQVTGTATVASGVIAITVGLSLRLFGGADASPATFALLLGIAAAVWIAAGAVYATIVEPRDRQPDVQGDPDHPFADAAALFREDRTFRRFVLARTLLLVSALSPPFVVVLATQTGGAGLAGLGPFVISSGLASLIGGRLWGRLADRSSRLTMMLGAGIAALVVVVFLGAVQMEAVRSFTWLYPAVYLLLALAHTGVRVGRKTYIVDLAEGDQRTRYVAVSNTAMGLLLLVAGGLSALVAMLGPEAALLFLAGLGLAGVLVSRALPEVSG